MGGTYTGRYGSRTLDANWEGLRLAALTLAEKPVWAKGPKPESEVLGCPDLDISLQG